MWKFCGHKFCGKRDTQFLMCHVTSRDHLGKGSWLNGWDPVTFSPHSAEFVGNRSPLLTTLLSLLVISYNLPLVFQYHTLHSSNYFIYHPLLEKYQIRSFLVRIQSKYGKIRTRKTAYLDIFRVVIIFRWLSPWIIIKLFTALKIFYWILKITVDCFSRRLWSNNLNALRN